MKTNLFTRCCRPSLMAALIAGLNLAAMGSEDSFDRLVTKWKAEREQILRRMTQAWLQGGKPESMKADLVTLAQIESGLATKPGITLYLSEVESTQDINATVGELVRTYLKYRGAQVNTTEFMRGKTFNVFKEQSAMKPKPKPLAERLFATK